MSDFVAVAKASDIPPGQARYYELAGFPIAICHVENEGFFAIDDVCTHDGGTLDQGELEGDEIECPRHGARFSVRTGAVLTLPAILPIHTYSVRVEDDVIYVNPTAHQLVGR